MNSIADTVIHAQIYKYLIDLHEIMNKIRANQGGSKNTIKKIYFCAIITVKLNIDDVINQLFLSFKLNGSL